MPFAIDNISKALMSELKKSGWEVETEVYNPENLIHYQAQNECAPLNPFTLLDLILMTLGGDSTSVEIRFQFTAKPKSIGSRKRLFDKGERADKFKTLRTACIYWLEKADIDATEEETEMTSIKDIENVSAAYEEHWFIGKDHPLSSATHPLMIITELEIRGC